VTTPHVSTVEGLSKRDLRFLRRWIVESEEMLDMRFDKVEKAKTMKSGSGGQTKLDAPSDRRQARWLSFAERGLNKGSGNRQQLLDPSTIVLCLFTRVRQ
jgi:hypothetical protein